MAIRILNIDEHPLVREGIGSVVSKQPDMELVGSASSGAEAIQCYRRHRPDITIMDLCLPDLSGIEVTKAILAEFPEARIIILTTFEGDGAVQRALRAGVYGYFLKTLSADELVKAIREVHVGSKRVQAELATRMAEHVGEGHLSTREIEILSYVAAGLRNREIGERLSISEETVKAHLRRTVAKLGARSRAHALVIANRRGLMRM